MHDQALLEFRRVDLPDFFDAEAVGLVLAVAAQVVFLDDLLGQAAVAALAEEGDAGVELHAALEAVFGRSCSRDSEVVCGDALDFALGGVEDFGRGEARVDLHSHLFCALAQPLGELVQRDDVVAVVVHLWGLRHGI